MAGKEWMEFQVSGVEEQQRLPASRDQLAQQSCTEHRLSLELTEEAKGVKMALIKVLEEGWRSVHIQSGSEYIADKLRMGSMEDTIIGTSLEDILNLKLLFDYCCFCSTTAVKLELSNRKYLELYALIMI
ncbi:hypothetical protein ACH5RR_039076 [Cinchona calisaya]|uniref:RNase H type-1 domain-containing protein n=1 Tax=Cinchona calisaya TaxID=153742 RepID=A0ABD2Y2R6_9GENT